jgi:acylglycerol lipase
MIHKEGKFRSQNNLNLYYQSWQLKIKPKAVLMVVHGLAEHSGRYTNLVDYFVPGNYAVYALDHQGHGRSEGLPGYVSSFSDYLVDLKTFFELIRQTHQSTKIYLVGHSMGGLIAASYTAQYPEDPAGLALSSPTLKAGSSISSKDILMAKITAALFPKMGIAMLDSSAISRDKKVIEAYNQDPLVHHGKIKARLACELLKAMDGKLTAQMSKIDLPILIMQGSLDRLSNPDGSQRLFVTVKSKDKTLKNFEGLYHELFNEPEHPQVLEFMGNWLNSRL